MARIDLQPVPLARIQRDRRLAVEEFWRPGWRPMAASAVVDTHPDVAIPGQRAAMFNSLPHRDGRP